MQDLSCSNMKATPSRLYNLILIRGCRPSIIFPERTLKVRAQLQSRACIMPLAGFRVHHPDMSGHRHSLFRALTDSK
jgi:hypothetical protein